MKKRLALVLYTAALLLTALSVSACGSIKAENPGLSPNGALIRNYPDKPYLTAEPIFLPGERVIVDGQELADSVELDGVLYVSLSGLCEKLGIALTEEKEAYAFSWRNETVEGTKGSAMLVVDSEILELEKPVLLHGREKYVPAVSFCDLLKIGVLHDPEYQTWYFTPSAGEWDIPEGYRVPVLMYHGVSDQPWGNDVLFVRPSRMEEQLQYLLDNGYDPIWFEDLEHIEDYDKPVILTFDDGYVDNYTDLFPKVRAIWGQGDGLGRHGLELGAVYEDDMLREMQQSGLVDIQSHTKTHRRLCDISDSDQLDQMIQSKLAIARLTGKAPFVLCYPEGAADRGTTRIMTGHYRFGVMMSGPTYFTGNDPRWVYRRYIARDTSLNEFVDLLER